jgi:hypothetical protein
VLPSDPVVRFMDEQFPQKSWLQNLSEGRRKEGITVDQLFDKASPFNWLKDVDVSDAYASLQYIEGFYLVREVVKKALEKRQAQINVAFVLPNDESKYYREFPLDVQKVLPMWFGTALDKVEVKIYFKCFKYGEVDERPYLGNSYQTVGYGQVGQYFGYLPTAP